MAYQVVLPVYEGPLDLLLHLIDTNELDIYDIPIAFITGKYMEYLRQAEDIDLNLSGEFVVMAGTLLVIKAKMLLPKRPQDGLGEGEGADPREELVEKLLEYRIYKENAQELKRMETGRTKIYYREVNESLLLSLFPHPNPVEGLTPADLYGSFREILRLMAARSQVITVQKDEASVNDSMLRITQAIDGSAGRVKFTRMMEDCVSLLEAVTMFLALLELLAKGRVRVTQRGVFGEIYIESGQAAQEA
ncbi:MAG: segregation/condensation protein A [Clostridiales bacterium]|nr:segregation/condensation protein A [Clostridiales bacterium]